MSVLDGHPVSARCARSDCSERLEWSRGVAPSGREHSLSYEPVFQCRFRDNVNSLVNRCRGRRLSEYFVACSDGALSFGVPRRSRTAVQSADSKLGGYVLCRERYHSPFFLRLAEHRECLHRSPGMTGSAHQLRQRDVPPLFATPNLFLRSGDVMRPPPASSIQLSILDGEGVFSPEPKLCGGRGLTFARCS